MLTVSRHSLVFGLSYALDILGGNNMSHSKSTAYISVMLAREIGLSDEEALVLYYAALLHDIGVVDEYDWKQKHVLNMEQHSTVGEKILKKLPLPKEIPTYVLYHHEYNDGTGAFGLSGKETPLGSQIICFASAFDDVFGDEQHFSRDLILNIFNWLDMHKLLFPKEITAAFCRLLNREYFLLGYFDYGTKYEFPYEIDTCDDIHYCSDDIEKFAMCFADIIDQRSPFTYNHSTGTAERARNVAAHLGYDVQTQKIMYVSGLLHDIGKLYVSVDILHKKGRLSTEERFEINKHTYYTRKILEQIQGFEEIVDIAANHHEKPNGTGYPYHLADEQLNDLEKIMAICDVYQALTEERPYRSELSADHAWEIIDKMAECRHLDRFLVERTKSVFS